MTKVFDQVIAALTAEKSSADATNLPVATVTELASGDVTVLTASDDDRAACKAVLSASFAVTETAGGLHVSLNASPELAARKAKDDDQDDSDGDDELGVLPTLKVIHDGAGFKIIHRLFAHYVGADGDFRNVMMFMRDVDDLLSRYRASLGLDEARPVEAGNVDAKQEGSLGPDQTRIDNAKGVRKAQKQMEDDAPAGNEVASTEPTDSGPAAE